MSATLILLVGSNPVPNYLSACALRPARIALVYTEETKDAKDRLKQELSRELGDDAVFVENPDPFVGDATSATVVRRVIDEIMRSEREGGAQEVWLSYTGGTKVMAAHARMAYEGFDGKAEHASYLDERGQAEPRLRFDSARSKALSEYAKVPLSLKTLLALHGVRLRERTDTTPAPTKDDAEAILRSVLADESMAERLYHESERLKAERNPNKVDPPFRAADHGITLSLAEFPTGEQLDSVGGRKARESWCRQWYKFIGGGWLEEWVGQQIHQIQLRPEPEITVGFDAFRGQKETQLEVDVAAIRGHRSYFISCTTDVTKDLCKLKLFEVAVRARNLGGDLARAALVCLAKEGTAGALRNDAEEVWGASNITQVFGRDDVRSWSQGKRHSLQAWLES